MNKQLQQQNLRAEIKEVYPNCEYTDDCEWVINETVPYNDIDEANKL